MNNNIAETICEAINIISTKTLEGLSYDKTVVCTIVDDSQRDKGIYEVQEDAAHYVAYSENTTYRKNTQVYVTIPGNNYDNQKMIIGKKVNEENEPVIYSSPFDSIIDIVGLEVEDDAFGLTANRPATYYEPYITNTPPTAEEFVKLQLYERNGNEYSLTKDKAYVGTKQYYTRYDNGAVKNIYSGNFYDKPYYGFSRIALQADFQAWLREYDCISGDYGLKVVIDFVSDEKIETDEDGKTTRTIDIIQKELYLSAADMIGNAYNFETYYTQAKAFDISPYSAIAAITIDFYQTPGSFIKNKKDDDNVNIPVPYLDDLGGHLFSNVFVRNCTIAIGYDIEAYDTDVARLYCFDKETYSSANDKKHIELKWIHINEDKSQVVMNEFTSGYEYEIRWYRYLLGEPSADAYCGSNWTSIKNPINSSNVEYSSSLTNLYEIDLIPDSSKNATEQIKAIILFGKAPGYQKVSITEEDYESAPGRYYIENNGEYTNCIDLEYSTEVSDYYILESDTRKIYKTQILEFTNTEDVLSTGAIDAVSALTLACFDEINNTLYPTQGNYLIYNQGNQLIDYGQSGITRGVRCKFNLVSTDDDDTDTLKDADSVTWIFPIKNTMIIPYKNETYVELDDELNPVSEVGTGTYGMITYDDSTTIETQMNSFYASPYFLYKIGTYFAPSKMNNYIQCIIVKDGITYRTAKELTFGQAGSAGTEFTFVLELEKNVNALLTNTENGEEVQITALLYDSTGKEQDLTGKSITWSFVNPADTSDKNTMLSLDGGNLTLVNGNDINNAKLVTTSGLNIETMCIVRAELVGWSDYKLITFLPVPIRNSKQHICVSGATSIVYLFDGTPQYYNSDYVLHSEDESIALNNVSWVRKVFGIDENTQDKKEMALLNYYPVPTERMDESGTYYLRPASIYVDGLPMFSIQAWGIDSEEKSIILWNQPILMIKNRYPIAMLNEWDGKELKIDSDNGAILSNMMSAGRKENDNSFSGVVLGDWTDNAQVNTVIADRTGIFGFNKGEMSFSFTDDGKATIGKSTGSQIIFDGTQSTITSRQSEEKGSGLKLDFDNGSIISSSILDPDGDGLTANSKEIDVFTLQRESPYLKINALKQYINEENKTVSYESYPILEVGNNNYYLQSINYIERKESEEDEYEWIFLGWTNNRSNLSRWKKDYGTIYLRKEDASSSGNYIYEEITDIPWFPTWGPYYKKEKKNKETENLIGSRFDLNSGNIEFNRGYVNGDILLRIPEGLKYNTYSYSTDNGVYKTENPVELSSASLSSILSDLLETTSYVKATAQYAVSIATIANGAANSALKNQNSITTLVTDLGKYLFSTKYALTTDQTTGEVTSSKPVIKLTNNEAGYILVSNGITLCGDNGDYDDIYLNGEVRLGDGSGTDNHYRSVFAGPIFLTEGQTYFDKLEDVKSSAAGQLVFIKA